MVHEGDADFGNAFGGPDSGAHPSALKLNAVPLFPLPDVVHFPHNVLPLHIFEPRYRSMIADALAGDRLIAMALIRAQQFNASANLPALHPIVCVGRIVQHERLADGRFTVLLGGQMRARIVSEIAPDSSHRRKPYRVGRLAVLDETANMEIDLERQRQRLHSTLCGGTTPLVSVIPVAEPFRELLSSTNSTATIADLMAFHLLSDIRLKQSLLSERSVPRRIDRLIHGLRTQLSSLEPTSDPNMN
jgi:Lon protease-like protein